MTQADLIRQRNNLPTGCPVQSPWGQVQWGQGFGDGLFIVSTAGHGGARVPTKLNKKIPVQLRRDNGWYEEDCEIAIPLYFLADYFQEGKEKALESIKNWFWKEWELYSGEILSVSDSRLKAEYLFLEEHKGDLLTTCAWGDWHKNVPKGMVGVGANLGGTRSETTEWFLVSSAEYETRRNNPAGSLVIDRARHQSWVGPNA